tara:strand:- start:594 stop:866 length:273 start_codon:yes stop_codon:yes gene_type:complete
MITTLQIKRKSHNGGKLIINDDKYVELILYCLLCSMGNKITTIDKRFSPSPSAYSITQYSVGANGQKWGFGTETRKGVASGSLSPGPGAY